MSDLLKPEVIISVIALIISITTFIIQNSNSKKSVMPYGNIICRDWEEEVSVKIKNAGIGPLIFNNLKVTDSEGQASTTIIDFMPELPANILWADYLASIEGQVLSPGEELVLIKAHRDEVEAPSDAEDVLKEIIFSSFRNDVRIILANLTIEIEYSDIYGKKFTNTKKLD